MQITTGLCDLRQEAYIGAPLVTQLQYGEEVKILAQHGDWTKIQSCLDHYQGFVWPNSLAKEQRRPILMSNACAATCIPRPILNALRLIF